MKRGKRCLTMLRRSALVAGLFLTGLVGSARADYALLQDGRALFNVRVVDTDTTEARPLRVLFKPQSFGYDYRKNSPFLLRGRSDMFNVADFVTTSTEITGTSAARQWVRGSEWHTYVPPPQPVIAKITPAPPTPVPPPTEDEVTPPNVADPLLPVEQRVQKQLDIFIQEQTTLAEQLKLYKKAGGVDVGRARQMRLDLLKRQARVLDKHYPAGDELIVIAKEALQHHIKLVQEQGRFNFEN